VIRPTNRGNQNLPVTITLSDAKIEEVPAAKLLGVWITNDLKFHKHIEKLTLDVKYSASLIWRVRRSLDSRVLRLMANGLIMSKIRYCAAVYGPEYVRLSETDPKSTRLQELQKVQNDALRLLTRNKRSDHVRIKDMLDQTGLMSVNQVCAYVSLIEYWKAREFRVPILDSILEKCGHGSRTLRSDTNGLMKSTLDEQYANTVAELWNKSSEKFKKTNLLIVAKMEAENLARSLPI